MEIIEQKRYLSKELPEAGFCEEHGHFTKSEQNLLWTISLPNKFSLGRQSVEQVLICPHCKLQNIIRICKRIACVP